MEWQQLNAFRHLARTGSFSKAAQLTLRTQPAVSQQIKALEADLGCVLVERSGRKGTRLTRAGERLLAFCDLAQQEEQALREELAALGDEPRHWLRLAAPLTTLVQLLPPLLAAYGREHPDVELTLWDRPQNQVVQLVRSGEADLGLALASVAPRGLRARPWKAVRPVLLVPQGHPLTREERPLDLAKISRYRLILPPPSPESSHRAALDELFTSQGLPCRMIMESANAEVSAALVEQGLGLAFASLAGEPPGLRKWNLRALSLEHLLPGDRIVILSRKGRGMPRHQQALVDLLLSEA
ncbi:MAG: LysR family transcriptional regulator [Desulfarculaceae bacterium]|nr:LysR family transcriptional regulator [Desulfarculaceae bacterium]MCF8047461.1 LysR family transcriptional regulator [Desulfarculaceae bacterium]MCF8065351.1 LysR family transcriptional regulator [Desulfarculaceae bacterium]MCF8098805.1 LysR family transcriptional regulator [Desulfarculaceae bacterium]MCF8124118.1 LysR family transcriptional regulator [Desulfarculaceae bacterium]